MIYGNFDAQRAAAGAKPPSFFGRLRGRKTAAVSNMDMGKSRLLEFPPTPFGSHSPTTAGRAAVRPPAGEYGYIEREAGELTADWSVLESHEDPDAVLKMLEQRYAGLLDDGRCHCEMCESRPAGA